MFLVVRRDLSTTIVPGSLFLVAAYAHTRGLENLWELLPYLAWGGIYFFLYVYVFCLGNQINGIEEDRLNKPDRPLPAGLVSLRGAWVRWSLANLAFPSVGFLLGGWRIARWALAWQAIAFTYDFLGLHRRWYGKNLVFITLGTVVLLAPAWELVAETTPVAWRWIAVVAVTIGISFHIQDLRDVEGDVAVGRVTLPVLLGESPARLLLAACVLAFPLVVHVFLMVDGLAWSTVLVIECLLGILNVIVAWRIWFLRTPRADHWTYIIHTYWFCAVLASAIPVLAAAGLSAPES